MRPHLKDVVGKPRICGNARQAWRVAEKRINPKPEYPMRKFISGLIALVSCALVFALVYILWRVLWGSFYWLWDNYYYFRVFVFLCSCAICYQLGRWSERYRK
jgi:hypothetical protein